MSVTTAISERAKAIELKPRQVMTEFKAFVFKSNMIDLAVAVIIGEAFNGVVKALVNDVLLPLISYVPGLQSGWVHWHIGRVQVGDVLANVLHFTLVALAVFLVIVKMLGRVMRHVTPGEEKAATRECPRCLSLIPAKATKCPHCTADLPEEPAVAVAAAAAPLPGGGAS